MTLIQLNDRVYVNPDTIECVVFTKDKLQAIVRTHRIPVEVDPSMFTWDELIKYLAHAGIKIVQFPKHIKPKDDSAVDIDPSVGG